MPLGAASGGQQGAQNAAASATLRSAVARPADGKQGAPFSRRAAAVVRASQRGGARSARAR